MAIVRVKLIYFYYAGLKISMSIIVIDVCFQFSERVLYWTEKPMDSKQMFKYLLPITLYQNFDNIPKRNFI